MIEEGNYVLVNKGSVFRLGRVQSSAVFHFEKLRIRLDGAIGHAFGEFFEVDRDGTLTQVAASIALADAVDLEDAEDSELTLANGSGGGDNRNVVECTASQALTQEEILAMRSEGTKPATIIERLIDNSATFEQRNEFGKQKYIARKTRVHGSVVALLAPTPRLLCDYFYRKDTEKICVLRADSLAYMLAMANVHAGVKALVVEECAGLVISAVLDRIGSDGTGSAVYLHKGGAGPVQGVPALDAMNFDASVLARFLPVPLSDVFDFGDGGESEPSKRKERSDNKPTTEQPQRKRKEREPPSEAEDARRREEQLARARKTEAGVRQMELGVDALLIATRSLDPASLLEALLPRLLPSRPFVVFSPLSQPLLALLDSLKRDSRVVNVQLSDSVVRRYQVLPGRTHPLMNDFVAGGWTLTGIRVADDPKNSASAAST